MKHVSYELRSTVVVPLFILFANQAHNISDPVVLRSTIQSPVLDACNRLAHPIAVEMRDEC